MSSVSNGLYFLTLPLVSVMRIIYRKIRHAPYLYIKRNVEKVWGARYLSKNTVLASLAQGTPLLNSQNHPKKAAIFLLSPLRKPCHVISEVLLSFFSGLSKISCTLFFQLCHFQVHHNRKCRHTHLYLTRHYPTVTHCTVLLQGGSDCADI